MRKDVKFYKCNTCGNIITKLNDSGVPVVCCGEEMEVLTANTVDASKEKHVPAVSVAGNIIKVEVGSVPHPMEEKHYIMWIYLQTKKGGQIKYLVPGNEPFAVFAIEDDSLEAVYEYCNLHGLWKVEV